MVKSLYDTSDKYSIEANILGVETHKAIHDLFIKYKEDGYVC